MPRSRRKIDMDNRAVERGRELLRQALRKYTGRLQATAVNQFVQGNAVYTAKVMKDGPLLRYLWGEGNKIMIRDALAEWGLIEAPGERPPQLELFPEQERDVVRQIGMARIWLPSRGAHVQYHDLESTALIEASAYYEAQGKGNLRTAELLLELAKLRGTSPRRRKAA